MNLLLDTHIAIWAVEDNPRLSQAARALLLEPAASFFVSVASLWEIAIKHAKHGAKEMPMSAMDALGFFHASGYTIVPVSPPHVLTLEGIARHHDDPFDRLLVATALTEPYRLITSDARLGAYGSMVTVV
jgi:PIN domain nuclease of toxin-antitoxin system